MNLIRRIIVATSIAFLATPAFASWDFVAGYPSGGTVTGDLTAPYALNVDGTYGGSAAVAPCSASGTITFKYVWNGTAAQKPPQVILKVTSSATWSMASLPEAMTPTGSASNGLGSPEIAVFQQTRNGPRLIGGTSQGVHYIVKDVVGNNIEFTVSPSATGGDSVGGGVKVEVIDASVNVGGTTTFADGTIHALIGQNQVGTVSVGGGLIPKVTAWSVSSSVQPFGKVIELGNAAHPDYSASYFLVRQYSLPLEYPNSSAGEKPTVSFYASKPEEETVQATVDLKDPNTLAVLATVTFTRVVAVEAPSAELYV